MSDTAHMEGSNGATPAATGARILYIDDDAALCRLVQRQLGGQGYAVEFATSGQDGLERIARGDVDVVALDHDMPGQKGMRTDGPRILTAILALPDAPAAIYLTDARESRIAAAALRAGASGYVMKESPNDFIELLASTIQAVLKRQRTRRSLAEAEGEIRAERDRLEALAAERTLLLREMNHRVGNSLQIIMSVLHLQAGSADNADVRDALRNARRRVSAVAQLHRRLYTCEHATTVAMDQYLGALLEDLQASAEHGEVGISLFPDIEPLDIDPDRAVALGVIVTELVINASKYAYPGGKGPVRVSLCVRDGTLLLAVEDDGVGLPLGGDAPAGLGNRIMRAMAAKLEATLDFPPRPKGTAVRVSIPLAKANA